MDVSQIIRVHFRVAIRLCDSYISILCIPEVIASHFAPTTNPRDGFQPAKLCPFVHLSVYLSYICCVCRKHIFGHVLRIDASLDYVIDDLTIRALCQFSSFCLMRFFVTRVRAPRFSPPSFLLDLRYCVSLLLSRTGLAFFKIYFGPVFLLCVLGPSRGLVFEQLRPQMIEQLCMISVHLSRWCLTFRSRNRVYPSISYVHKISFRSFLHCYQFFVRVRCDSRRLSPSGTRILINQDESSTYVFMNAVINFWACFVRIAYHALGDHERAITFFLLLSCSFSFLSFLSPFFESVVCSRSVFLSVRLFFVFSFCAPLLRRQVQ